MKKLKCLLTGIILLLITSSVAFASDLTYETIVDFDLGTVNVSGTASKAESGKYITVKVELIDNPEIPEYIRQIKTGDNGKFNLSFSLDAPGRYKLYLSEEAVLKIYEYEFHFTKTFEANSALKEINEATKETIESVMKNVHYKLNLSELFYELSDENVSLTEFYYSVAEHDDFIDVSEFLKWFKEMIFVYAVNNNSDGEYISDIIECYGEEIGIHGLKLYSLYNSLESEEKNAAGSMLASGNITDIDELKVKFGEVALLKYIYFESSYGKVGEALKTYGTEAGLNLIAYLKLPDTAYVDKGICGKMYNSLIEFQKEIDTLVAAFGVHGMYQSVGGSSGGGSSGGSNISVKNASYENSGNEPFNDLSSAMWAEESILYLYENGIISAATDKCFRPDDKITRAEFSKMLVEAFDLFDKNSYCNFYDVTENDWYYPYVSSGYRVGLLKGIGNNLFGALNNITRMDATVMAYRFSVNSGMQFAASNESFADSYDIAGYAAEAVLALKGENIINGYEGNVFNPYSELTRAEAAKIIHRLLERYYEK